MNKQRFILADYYQQPDVFYHATFDHISSYHKFNHVQPVVLLLNLYLVNKQDKTIELRRPNAVRDSKGKSLVADHVWVEVNYNFFQCIPQELLYGDEIFFKAKVEQYKINREDILLKRNLIWEKTKELNDSIFTNWLATRKQYKGEQYAIRQASMQAQIRQNNAVAKKAQAQIKLVDYGLTDLNSISVSKYQPTVRYKTFHRIKYDLQKIQANRHDYTSWLSQRTIEYKHLLNKKH